jgi:hypothetical protein
MGQAHSTSWILIQQQLPREHQFVTFWSTLWMTLPHTTELVWVWRKGYLWSRHCDGGRREGEANPSKHPSRPSCQKSYTNKRRNPLDFKVGDHVYLRVSPMKGVRRFGIKGKLAPRYIGPYPIIDKYGPASCQVALLAKLSGVHNVFYVSQLKNVWSHWCCYRRYHLIETR